ncbi:MAG: trigger factor [Desulfuromonadaceae bacterium]|nr:trigger factor [Desulfuromonas sp.]MDY0185046.1 trigger factor [Desulfuromonadaceae bacterium]
MNTQVEDLSSVKKKISVEVDAAQVNQEITAVYAKIARNAKLKGFRQGKVPMRLVKQYYAEQMEHEVVGKLINDTYFKAITDSEVAAIGEPAIQKSGELVEDKVFTYEFYVDVKPKIENLAYSGLSLKKEIYAFDDSVVDTQIAQMLDSRTQKEAVKRDDVQNGDFVTLDFEGFVGAEAFAGGAAQDHELEIGSGSFIPGFEDQLVGMKRGEEGEVKVTFPADYGNDELAGKEATFKVKISEIKEKTVPELTDELAQEFGAESAADLRAKISENYDRQEKQRIEEELKERLMAQLVERNSMEVPETMVAGQLDFMLQNIKGRLKSQGMSLEMMGMNEEAFRAMYRDTAVKQVQGSLILEGVGSAENISVDEGEIDARLEEIAEMANAPLEDVKKYYSSEDKKEGLLAQIEEEKVIAYLLGQADIQELTKEELDKEKQDAPEEQE